MIRPAASSRIRDFPRSGVRETMELALASPGAIRLDIGDPDFDTPAHIGDAAARAAREGFTHYGPSSGLPSVRELVAAKVAAVNGFDCLSEQVVVTVGGSGGIFATLLALLDPGDEVIVPDPGWPNYLALASAAGVVPVRCPLDARCGFEPNAAEVDRRIGPRTKAMIVNTPGNPMGAVFSLSALAALVETAARRGLWVISDECYDELVLEGEHVSTAALGDPDRIVSVFSFSKTYAMTGWRLGYVVAPRNVAPLVALAQEAILSCPSTPAQKGAEAALTGPREPVTMMRAAYRRRRDGALDLLDAHGVRYVRPRGAFYLMVDISRAGASSREFARRLLLEDGVAVVPGSAFGQGGEGMVRVSLAGPEDLLMTGLARLASALEQAPVAA